MTDQQHVSRPTGGGWDPTHAYLLAAICLLVGVAIGYLFRGSQPPVSVSPANAAAKQAAAQPDNSEPSNALDQMRRMADAKAEPLLLKLKTDGANADLLFQVGNIYRSAHQFQDAAGYYQKALSADPKNVVVRIELASCLYYAGDADGALAQLQQSLKDDPTNANALFNLGVIRRDAKNDKKGAVAAWRELLKTNPNLGDKRAIVEKLIADAAVPGNKT